MALVAHTDTGSGMGTAGRPFCDVPAGGVGVRRGRRIPREWIRPDLLRGVDWPGRYREVFLRTRIHLEARYGNARWPDNRKRIEMAKQVAALVTGREALARPVAELARHFGLPVRTLERRAELLRRVEGRC